MEENGRKKETKAKEVVEVRISHSQEFCVYLRPYMHDTLRKIFEISLITLVNYLFVKVYVNSQFPLSYCETKNLVEFITSMQRKIRRETHRICTH